MKRMKLGCLLITGFLVWTWMIQNIDVQPVGINGTEIGFAVLNLWFHELTGVHMKLYTITDWLGLIPVFICTIFAGMGLVQLLRRKSLWKVDKDIIIIGVYYVIVILGYLIFEMYPVNYRPILVEGRMEASYPSSTTLLVLSVMPTLIEQANRKMKEGLLRKTVKCGAIIFSLFMVMGRMISGVHWFTDIVGAIILSTGLFCIYKASINRRF